MAMCIKMVLMITVGVSLSCCIVAQAVTMDWVNVGDAGNEPDTRYDSCGAVAYWYRISKYEVTNAQYIEFLNAVAKSDEYGLYNPYMGGGDSYECGGISRYGSDGGYTYGPKGGDANWLNKPVNWISWYNALRFANWMHNGKPVGAQDSSTTEDGAYDMSLGASVTRKPGARVWIPSENEWYKAAYYKGGGTDAGYWDYATQNDTTPNNNPPSGDTGNSANYKTDSFTIGAPYYSTDVGAYSLSVSAYGTYDQSGNVWEWNEELFGEYRGIRGGSWSNDAFALSAADRHHNAPESGGIINIGIRLASIPEPTTLSLLVLSSIAVMQRWRIQ